MIIIVLLSCVAVIATALPVSSNVHHKLQLQKEADQRGQPVEATNQISEAHMAAPLLPGLDQPQPGLSQQPDPQTSPQPSLQQYAMFAQGGGPMIFPLPQSVYTSLPANQLTLAQQPLIIPPYGFLPLFPSPYSNQMFPPYRFPMVPEPGLPQTPTQQLPNAPALPAETVAGAAGPAVAPPPQVQQQTPQIVYMLQQPMNPSLGGLSSEELQTVAKMNQLGMFMPSVLANLPAGAGAGQPESQAAGLKVPEPQAARQTVETSAAGVPQSQGPPCSGSRPIANSIPAGLERAASEAQTRVLSKLKPVPGNRV